MFAVLGMMLFDGVTDPANVSQNDTRSVDLLCGVVCISCPITPPPPELVLTLTTTPPPPALASASVQFSSRYCHFREASKKCGTFSQLQYYANNFDDFAVCVVLVHSHSFLYSILFFFWFCLSFFNFFFASYQLFVGRDSSAVGCYGG